jgi:hypothetical protein
VGVLGAVMALVLRSTDRARYEQIGSTVLAESQER